ncbi:hypothetical protein [Thiomicrospira microaerophila]|uniref:hypothetical protein n=1 Tax=Thiomicrospira microaerophila TaxID=406020 RepID=UPI0005CA96B6|nr:hypothetical protein [Thiomicrospira microaerophila]
MKLDNYTYLSVGFLIVVLSFSVPASASGEFYIEQSFSFGRLVVLSSPDETSITIHPDGQISHNDNFRIVEPGFPAIFEMRAFPANTHFTYAVSVLKRMGPFELDVTPSSGTGWFSSNGSYPPIAIGGTLIAPSGQFFHNNLYSWNIFVSVIVNH